MDKQVMKALGQKSATIKFGEEEISLDLEEILKQQNGIGEISE